MPDTMNWPNWAEVCLEACALAGTICKAAAAAGVSGTTVLRLMKDDERFRTAMLAARAEAVDRLEATAWERATEGVLRPIYQAGQLVGHERIYSDRLLELLLRGNIQRYAQSHSVFQLTAPSAGEQAPDTVQAVNDLLPLLLKAAKPVLRREGA